MKGQSPLSKISDYTKELIAPLPFRGTLTGWRNVLMGISWSSAAQNAEPCTGRSHSEPQLMLGERAASQRRTDRQTASWTWANSKPLCSRDSQEIPGCTGKSCQQIEGGGPSIVPSTAQCCVQRWASIYKAGKAVSMPTMLAVSPVKDHRDH